MNEKQTILVTTDGSAPSHRVLPHAALLARALGLPLTLLQVVEAGEAELARSQAAAALAHFGIEADVLCEPATEGEETAEAVLRVAKRAGAAVVALDSRGHGALRHALHGSVALDVLKTSELPLLVSGPNLEVAPAAASPYRVVATCDGSAASETVLRELAALAGGNRIEVTLLRVHEHLPGGEDDAAAVETCRKELEATRGLLPRSLPVQTALRQIPLGAGVDTAIIEAALEAGAHAIAMSTHGHSARRHVVMGSVAMMLLGRSPLPLLLARAV